MRVYYFTEAKIALSNIALRRIKISRLLELNDPFEFCGVDLRNKVHRKAILETIKKMNQDKGLLCFSESWDSSVMWSHYAESHRGVCLGFDVRDSMLTPVTYKKTRPKFPVDASELSVKWAENLLYTKQTDWKYEKEFRFFVQLDHSIVESGLYFYDFSEKLQLCEVILGPRCELPIGSIRNLLAGFDPQVYVIKARLAHTKFKVVENRNATRVR
jgi:hypothetical protein